MFAKEYINPVFSTPQVTSNHGKKQILVFNYSPYCAAWEREILIYLECCQLMMLANLSGTF